MHATSTAARMVSGRRDEMGTQLDWAVESLTLLRAPEGHREADGLRIQGLRYYDCGTALEASRSRCHCQLNPERCDATRTRSA